MRVTNKLITNNVTSNIQSNLSKLARTQEELSTSKSMLRPSDKPENMSQLLSVKRSLTYLEQYQKNVDDGLSYLYLSDSSMQTVGDILHTAGEMAVQAANDTYSDEDRDALAEQIDKMIDQVKDLANSSVGGRFIYAGTQNSKAPFQRNGDIITYTGDLNGINREVLTGDEYRIDQPGISTAAGTVGVFGHGTENPPLSGSYDVYNSGSPNPPAEKGIFDILFELRDSLRNNDPVGIQAGIDNIKQKTDQLLERRVGIGSRTKHFEGLKDQMNDVEVKLTDMMDKLEGADMYKLSINMSQEQATYQASLASGANIMKVSLLDFLK